MNVRCITNNPLVLEKKLSYVESVEGDTLAVLESVKKEILKGYKLVTHPLTSSIRPDMSPYKTVVLTWKKGNIDADSLEIIEKSIEYTVNLINNSKEYKWDDASLKDFQFIDKDLVKSFI